MKSSEWVLPALLAVSLCTPLMAQDNKDLEAKIQHQIQLQVQMKQMQHSKAAKCWRCGQEITSVSQRCAADCDVSCMPEREPEAKPQAKKQEKAPAKTRVEKTESLGKCWQCGQEITSEFQRCPADCDVFCVPSQEAGK